MSERFEKLFSLIPNLFMEGCPIIIEAGALLKDTSSGKILAQVKMRNIAKNTILSCKVSIKAYDSNGCEIEEADYTYSDLKVKSGESFGDKVPIFLPNENTNSFDVSVTEVAFLQGEVVPIERHEWRQLPTQKTLKEVLGKKELVNQYKMEVGEPVKFVPQKSGKIVQCTCGTVYQEDEGDCYNCGRAYGSISKYLDADYLKNRIEERCLEENEERLRIKKKKKKVLIITLCIVVALVVAITSIVLYQKAKAKADAAEVAELTENMIDKHFIATTDRDDYLIKFGRTGYFDKGVEIYFRHDDKGEWEYKTSYSCFEIKKQDDTTYMLDVAERGKDLFYNGDYKYIVTNINHNQISAFKDVDEYIEYELEDTVKGLTASYDGSTEEGVEIEQGCDGLSVCARYDDDWSGEVENYKLKNPSKLARGKTSSFTIEYGGLTKELRITCTTLPLDQFKAKCKNVGQLDHGGYIGDYVKIRGKVISGDSDICDVETKNGAIWRVTLLDNGEVEDTNGDGDVYEGDKVVVYGTMAQSIKYKNNMWIYAMDARVIVKK